MQELTARSDRPTAIVCANGLLTPYVLEGIHSAGLQIPRDISFLCFGDSAWHRGYSPPLSVIRHDYAAAANRSVERLIARIEGRDIPEISRRPSEFIARDSIARPPHREG
jgi:DNA-binding LacI/PurR family transcriptional regulator